MIPSSALIFYFLIKTYQAVEFKTFALCRPYRGKFCFRFLYLYRLPHNGLALFAVLLLAVIWGSEAKMLWFQIKKIFLAGSLAFCLLFCVYFSFGKIFYDHPVVYWPGRPG